MVFWQRNLGSILLFERALALQWLPQSHLDVGLHFSKYQLGQQIVS